MERYEAIGLIETFGLVFVLEAADAMVKAADVELIGYENVASGYIRPGAGGCGSVQDRCPGRSKGSGSHGGPGLQLCCNSKTPSASGENHNPLLTGGTSASGVMEWRHLYEIC